jgi:hypothetical protein
LDELDLNENEGSDFVPTKDVPHENVIAYLGNMHVAPLSRLWNTNEGENTSRITPLGKTDETHGRKIRPSKPVKSATNKSKMVDPRVQFAKMMYVYRRKNIETAEEQIKKQALMEVMFQTQVWNEPYVRHNPWLYISPRSKDFTGEHG